MAPSGFKDGLKMAAGWPQDAFKMQDRFQMLRDGFEMVQGSPKWLQDCFKMASRNLKNGALA